MEKKTTKEKEFQKQLEQKVDKYENLTKRALEEIKIKTNLNEKEKLIAKDFIEMSKNYFSDGKYYKNKNDFLTALASFSYAHAWLDAGVRARLFDATDDQLFTLP